MTISGHFKGHLASSSYPFFSPKPRPFLRTSVEALTTLRPSISPSIFPLSNPLSLNYFPEFLAHFSRFTIYSRCISIPPMILHIFLFIFLSPLLVESRLFDKPSQQISYIEGILRESLRSNRVQACDGERITLSCPRNTQIMVQTGFYGRVVPESQLCPAPANRSPSPKSSINPIHHSSTCDVIQAHTRISEICDKRRKCTVVVDSHTFQDDPCPSTSKYLQMSYACMPVSFDEETFCSNTEIRLECREGRRLAVYSAHMRTSPQCSRDNKTMNDCSTDVLPQVLKECHAKELCNLHTDLISTNCHDAHLHIVYVCVNDEIFSEEAIKGELASLDSYPKEVYKSDFDEDVIKDLEDEEKWERIVDSHIEPDEPTIASAPVHQINNDASYVTHDEYRMEQSGASHDMYPSVESVEPNIVGVGHDVLQVVTFFKQNKEKALTCAILSVSMAAIIVLSACIVKRLCRGSADPHRKQSTNGKSRSRHSLETSRLVTSNYGGSLTPQMHDIEDETFLRYSLGGSTSKPNSHYSHYDF